MADANGGCPFNQSNMMPWIQNAPDSNDIKGDASNQDDQKVLSTARVTSSIPKDCRHECDAPNNNATFGHPQSAAQTSPNWMYPSPQMFYNALKKKGYDNVSKESMDVIVPIHNMVNEQCWQEILRWERLRSSKEPKLVRFIGRPNDMSPMAWVRHHLLGYTKPFDRHDWYVSGGPTGETIQRYVIDFYQGGNKATGQPSKQGDSANSVNSSVKATLPLVSVHLHVRPAADGADGLMMRINKFLFGFARKSSQSQH